MVQVAPGLVGAPEKGRREMMEREDGKEEVLILGARGMLGHALMEAFPGATGRGSDLDITDIQGISSFIADLHPTIVINAAAYTDVDGCESNTDHAMAVNGEAPGTIARACRRCGAIMVQFSTDYVFNGEGKGYRETDTPCPVNTYGASKHLGEVRVAEECEDYRVIRTSWLFGPHGRNFVDTIRRLGATQESVMVVNDQRGSPTYSKDLAYATQSVIRKEPDTYHQTNQGVCSWYQFASAIIPNAVPCTTEEYLHRPAKRPRCSALINTRTPPLRPWQEALSAYLSLVPVGIDPGSPGSGGSA